jgi:hypothetical protein
MATTNPIGGVFWRMVAAELRKLLSRPSGVVMIVISALLPILVFALAKAFESFGASVSANGQPVAGLFSLEGPRAPRLHAQGAELLRLAALFGDGERPARR